MNFAEVFTSSKLMNILTSETRQANKILKADKSVQAVNCPIIKYLNENRIL